MPQALYRLRCARRAQVRMRARAKLQLDERVFGQRELRKRAQLFASCTRFIFYGWQDADTQGKR